ncbi:succinate dehydrogenase (ubiquinone) [Acididesulfobacillus acetoxydans]|uniref:succinate dehydrogenase n=1 Tax=Acididesulfobacillus acetoxydans TaxID=1561005 RepID=A0A8S0WZ93_9FIRM|nr:succinate dehydrogenase iron-sulfur subunit [Acididesulfobacillus acetoxydans]CAA7601861.1 succinate dehydrogenase (ubiquinone) [Acididesulfobacillus acetoxydans]CEJ08664.1 Succinate dehydrogenase iron-sulfur subunit [Acididesulfobacillus acetoxydans]
MAENKEIRLKIRRQDGPGKPSRWEEFTIEYHPKMNVISCLMEIQKNPVTADGKKTTAVVWECNCLEEVCGACSMNINGQARQACSALIDQLEQPIVLEPLTKFPLVRDLMVDRQIMFDNLKKVHAWIPIDGTYDLGPGPRMAEIKRQWAYELSKCMTCGCCMEACPQVNSRSKFIGPAAISQVRLFNAHPTGEMNKHERLAALLDDGGITDCGNAQNCVRACPKNIPLTTSIADLNRETNKFALNRWLRK